MTIFLDPKLSQMFLYTIWLVNMVKVLKILKTLSKAHWWQAFQIECHFFLIELNREKLPLYEGLHCTSYQNHREWSVFDTNASFRGYSSVLIFLKKVSIPFFVGEKRNVKKNRGAVSDHLSNFRRISAFDRKLFFKNQFNRFYR